MTWQKFLEWLITEINAVSGFKVTEIWLLDKNIFTDSDFIAAEHESALREKTLANKTTTSTPAIPPTDDQFSCFNSTQFSANTCVSPQDIHPIPVIKTKTSN